MELKLIKINWLFLDKEQEPKSSKQINLSLKKKKAIRAKSQVVMKMLRIVQ
jgi:hypothetical protein